MYYSVPILCARFHFILEGKHYRTDIQLIHFLVDIMFSGITPLIEATQEGHSEIVQILLMAGVNVQYSDCGLIKFRLQVCHNK